MVRRWLSGKIQSALRPVAASPRPGVARSKRAIQKLIQDPLALKILDGEVLHGDHVVVDAKGGKMKFEVSHRVGEPVKSRR